MHSEYYFSAGRWMPWEVVESLGSGKLGPWAVSFSDMRSLTLPLSLLPGQ